MVRTLDVFTEAVRVSANQFRYMCKQYIVHRGGACAYRCREAVRVSGYISILVHGMFS